MTAPQSSVADALFTKTQQKILAVFFGQSGKSFKRINKANRNQAKFYYASDSAAQNLAVWRSAIYRYY
jgi:hypothetical protein